MICIHSVDFVLMFVYSLSLSHTLFFSGLFHWAVFINMHECGVPFFTINYFDPNENIASTDYLKKNFFNSWPIQIPHVFENQMKKVKKKKKQRKNFQEQFLSFI